MGVFPYNFPKSHDENQTIFHTHKILGCRQQNGALKYVVRKQELTIRDNHQQSTRVRLDKQGQTFDDKPIFPVFSCLFMQPGDLFPL